MTEKNFLKLEKDVEEFVKSKIKNIKCVDEIFINYRFSISKPFYDINKNLYGKLYESKKILQLMLNAYNDYETYKNYIIKFVPSNRDASPSQYHYKCFNDNGILPYLAPPTEKDMIKVLLDYARCFLSLNIKENIVNVSPENMKALEQCIYCDNPIKPDDETCPGCGSDVKEMMIEEAAKNVTKVYGNIPDNVIPERDNKYIRDKVLNDDIRDDRREHGMNNTTVAVTGVDENKRLTMWKCGKCEGFNAYICANCTICGELFEDGTWSCRECTLDNSCIDNVCTACEAMNYNLITDRNNVSGGDIAVGVFIDKRTCGKCGLMMDDNDKCNKCIDEATINKDQWKCGKCSKLYSYFQNMCDGCGATKIGSGKWQCGKCTFENDCKNKQCTICDEKNDLLMARYCDRCKVVVVTENKTLCDDCEKYSNPKYKPKQWICQYPRCDVDNSDADNYCRTCRLQRDYPRGRGDNVKMWYDDKENIMWICTKCHVINKQHELVCRNCQETRFKKKYCKKCQQYNDGTTNNCDICYQRL